jgi:hypothetical protein
MRQLVRLFLLLEAASFAAASLVHGGILLTGYQHAAASTAEGSIAILLLAGFALTWLWPMRTRLLGLAAQTAALLGTLVGVFTIAIGIGPRTAPDVTYHVAILAVLVWGLVVAARMPTSDTRPVTPAR